MLIRNVGREDDGGVARVTADVVWEQADRPELTLFSEAADLGCGMLWADPNALLLACLLPAWHHGERRVSVEGAVCPALLLRLRSALTSLATWYPQLRVPPVIEAEILARQPLQSGAISFLSGGIDSLATLRWSMLHLPPDHPQAVRTCAAVIYEKQPSRDTSEHERRVAPVKAALEPITRDARVSLVPVVTNMWWLDGDGYFFDEKWHGSVLASVAHFLSRGGLHAYIGAGDSTADLVPWGSHPMLDPFYSSGHMAIEHHAVGLTRLEKTALVAQWPAGLRNIRVCPKGGNWSDNCGTCEKCIRTMTTLVCLGALDMAASFPDRDVTPELLATISEHAMLPTPAYALVYVPLIEPLRARGRGDLADALIAHVLRPMGVGP
jgi:hypothetical protein